MSHRVNAFKLSMLGHSQERINHEALEEHRLSVERTERLVNALEMCVNGQWDEYDTCIIAPVHGLKLEVCKQALAALEEVE